MNKTIGEMLRELGADIDALERMGAPISELLERQGVDVAALRRQLEEADEIRRKLVIAKPPPEVALLVAEVLAALDPTNSEKQTIH